MNIPKKEKKTSNHYVDNKKFFEAMVEYKKLVDAAPVDQPKPKIPDYIGECFIKIATHLSYKPNFLNYTFRDDMISDGIENCIQYIDNFDPEKTNNPFAYFTQMIYFAFIRRIQKEKKQLYIKYKSLERMNIEEELRMEGKSKAKTDIFREESMRNDFISNYEEGIVEQKKKLKESKARLELEKLLEEEGIVNENSSNH